MKEKEKDTEIERRADLADQYTIKKGGSEGKFDLIVFFV